MPLYRLHLKWQGKEFTLTARDLDMTHPYFVSIKNLVFQKDSPVIINPTEDEINKQFHNSKNLMFPLQSISLIEELEPEKMYNTE